MLVEKNVALQPYNSFHIVARAQALARIRSEQDLRDVLADPLWGRQPHFVLGGGSNLQEPAPMEGWQEWIANWSWTETVSPLSVEVGCQRTSGGACRPGRGYELAEV